ncbi:MAG: Pesticin receptor [Gammaproteobacteria bacterium]|nr:Pesticin receptor [Gammaproteobacteria bacterium]
MDGSALEEVVVTAQKRAETLQSVPVSVTVLTGAQLGELKLDTPSDLVTQIPNLQVDGIIGEGSPIFSLRGVSMFDYSLSQSSPVASYIDEVYKGSVVLFGVEMYDLERIEVLRGPQGTLYGKNTTGGAINFITHKPGFDEEGYIKLGVGNYDRKEAGGAFQAGLIPDRLAVRLAFTYTKSDGFVHNVLAGYPDLEGIDQYGVRLSLLYKATDDLDLTLRYSKSMQDPQDYAIIAGSIAPGGIAGAGYYRTSDGTATGTPLANDQVGQNYTPRRRQDNQAVALTANWNLSSAVALTSITSWDEGSVLNPEATDGAAFDIFKSPYTGKTRQVTQDLRLTSPGDAVFSYIAGAYYQHEIVYNSTENQLFNFLDVNGDGVLNYQDCADASFGAGQGYSVGSLINAGCRYYNAFDQIRNSWAVYSDMGYAASKLVKLRGGVRYNHDNAVQKNALAQLRGSDDVPIASITPGSLAIDPNAPWTPVEALPGSPNYDAIVNARNSQALHNTAVSGRAGIDFTLTADSLLYVSYSRGYRSGAFNGQFLFSITDFTSVKPETLDSIEAGWKTQWLDRRLQLNGAIFHYQYKNQQIIDIRPTGQQPVINLGKSKIDGGELELVTRPVRPLTVRVGIGVLDAKIQEGKLAGGTIDVSGHTLPNAPKFSGTLSTDWNVVMWQSAGLTLHFDGNYASKQYFELINAERIAQDGYAILNARVMLHSPVEANWEVGAWIRNMTDRFYLTSAADLQSIGFDYRHRGVPRTFGLDATYRF